MEERILMPKAAAQQRQSTQQAHLSRQLHFHPNYNHYSKNEESLSERVELDASFLGVGQVGVDERVEVKWIAVHHPILRPKTILFSIGFPVITVSSPILFNFSHHSFGLARLSCRADRHYRPLHIF